ncbi:hypothetical protein GX48_06486 [Paracoccidioides brasiliensis]|nr:hypothetical protein GX48_06486 [Paracoccidioides brasiliensis]
MQTPGSSRRRKTTILPPRPDIPNGVALEEIVPNKHDANLSRIRKFAVRPSSSTAQEVSQWPCLRRVQWRRDSIHHAYKVPPVSRTHHRDALVYQTRGQTVYSGDDMCSGCQGGRGPFVTCVVAMTSDGNYAGGACANCVWRRQAHTCTLKQPDDIDSGESEYEESECETDGDEDGDEEVETNLQTPPPSQASKRKASWTNRTPTKSSKTVSSNRVAKRKPLPQEPSDTGSHGRSHGRNPKIAVIIPSRSNSSPTSSSKKYFRIPPSLSPNITEDIRQAVHELDELRTKLYSRLEVLESILLESWE